MKPSSLTENPWQRLNRYTDARIALGRCGVSLPTREHLAFQMSHAMARDAVHLPLDAEGMKKSLDTLSFNPPGSETFLLSSQVGDRGEYLKRPDLGRKLCTASREELENFRKNNPEEYGFSIVIGDGLSSRAMEVNTVPFLKELYPLLEKESFHPAPLALVLQARVAVADEVANLLNTPLTVILIGERPGLSSPDSMGLYMTWHPHAGMTKDDQRNCISNVRPQGMNSRAAAEKLLWLMVRARELKLSGVDLKDEQPAAVEASQSNFIS